MWYREAAFGTIDLPKYTSEKLGDDFEFEKVEVTDKAMIAFITATGKMNVKIDGMD